MDTGRRRLLKVAAVGGMGAVLAMPVFARRAYAKEPIKIGLPTVLSGGNAQYGIQARRACELLRQGDQRQGWRARSAPGVHLRGYRGRSGHGRAQGAEARREGRREVPHRNRAVLGGAGRLRQVSGVEGHPDVDHQRSRLAHRQGLQPLLLPHQHQRPHGRAGGEHLPGRIASQAFLRARQRLRLGARRGDHVREADRGDQEGHRRQGLPARGHQGLRQPISPRSSRRGPTPATS